MKPLDIPSEALVYLYAEPLFVLPEADDASGQQATPAQPAAEAEAAETQPEVERHPFAVVMDDPGKLDRHAELSTLLGKILATQQQTLSLVELLSRAAMAQALTEGYNPDKVLFFGVEVQPDLPAGTQAIATHSLEDLANDSANQRKRQLWAELKRWQG